MSCRRGGGGRGKKHVLGAIKKHLLGDEEVGKFGKVEEASGGGNKHSNDRRICILE